jgi:homoserine kinase type II
VAVYTALDRTAVSQFLRAYPVGALLRFQGISAGLANSNYRVDTNCGRYVLTLFEDYNSRQIAPLLAFSRYLAQRGLPCPRALSPSSNPGQLWQALKGRPASLVPWLPGSSPMQPDRRQAQAIGSALARLHRLGQQYRGPLPCGLGADWNPLQLTTLRPRLRPAQRLLMQREHINLASLPLDKLPGGPIHSDLFRDNSLFQGHRLSGLLDLYDASRGPLLYDLAVTVNDWCSSADGALKHRHLQALLRGYQRHRPLTRLERHCWPGMLRAAALRFWLSRLQYQQTGQISARQPGKQPQQYLRILQHRIISARSGRPALPRQRQRQQPQQQSADGRCYFAQNP